MCVITSVHCVTVIAIGEVSTLYPIINHEIAIGGQPPIGQTVISLGTIILSPNRKLITWIGAGPAQVATDWRLGANGYLIIFWRNRDFLEFVTHH